MKSKIHKFRSRLEKGMSKKLICILFFAASLHAQGQSTFQKTFGESNGGEGGNFIQSTDDGGFIVTGFTYSHGLMNGYGETYLLKMDSNADIQWTKGYCGTDYDYGYCVQPTGDKGYVVTGYSKSLYGTDYDMYLLKTATDGTAQWSNFFGGGGNDFGYYVLQTPDKGFAVSGWTNSFGAGGDDMYLVKTNSAGNTVWAMTYGGAGNDAGSSMIQTEDKGFVITGSTTSFGAGGTDVYMIRTDSDGNVLWSKTFGGAGNDVGLSIQKTADNGFIISGYTTSYGAGSEDVYLIKTDVNGNLLWSKVFGGVGIDEGQSVKQAADGGFVVAGTTYSFGSGSADSYLLKTDSNGNLVWSRTFGGVGYDQSLSVLQAADGGFLSIGQTGLGMGNGDIYLIKTDANGNSNCHETSPNTAMNTAGTQTAGVTSLQGTGTSQNAFTFAPTTGGQDSMLCASTTTALSENASGNEGVLVFPNPSSGSFTIHALDDKIQNVDVFNMMGEKIKSEEVTSRYFSVNLNSQPDGVYFIQLKKGTELMTQKVVIQK